MYDSGMTTIFEKLANARTQRRGQSNPRPLTGPPSHAALLAPRPLQWLVSRGPDW